MDTKELPYNPGDVESILRHAEKLLGKSLRQLYPDADSHRGGKGSLGQAVEEFHFRYTPNSRPESDFANVGLELKCTPLKRLSDGSVVSKERLVLNIIDYMVEPGQTFETSNVMKKCALMLLMFYLHEVGVSQLDLIFNIIRKWSIPPEDRKIFEDDWTVIHNKIIEGRAHELSEGDTLYLAACTKGSKGQANKRAQPKSPIMADQRAFSIKSSYINTIIFDSLLNFPESCSGIALNAVQLRKMRSLRAKMQKAVTSTNVYRGKETFEGYIARRFSAYYGKTIRVISSVLGIDFSVQSKSFAANLCRRILGVRSAKIAEFESAGVCMKVIRLDKNGMPREAMSFPRIRYDEIVKEEEWENSEWFGMLSKRFFFVVFRGNKESREDDVLEKVFFWTMPNRDLDTACEFWRDTRDKIRRNDYGNFWKESTRKVCHVRPKARNAADTVVAPSGDRVKKLCYWINRNYVFESILQSAASQQA